ncbi:DUF7260 family protein [Natronoarchaeum philippinense]|uniref:DUF7260 family protein n=1 Tax=Natronoarchaeum philippinense TaxID=558529 RepID=UPI000BE38CAB|nr:hypothetical protein [Natronoarchaeum philippinense]
MESERHTQPLEAAEASVRRERRWLVDEQQAFEQFAKRVRNLDADRPQSGVDRTLTRRDASGLRVVRDAYEETVMSVPHYREEYDQPYAASVAGELSEELAAALTNCAQFHPHLKQKLLEATQQAIDSREQLIGIVDAERAAIETVSDTIDDLSADIDALVGQPLDELEFNALRLTRERLRSVRDRCDEIAADRQATLQDQRRSLPAGIDDLGEYLYADCETTYPVLSALAELRRHVDGLLTGTDRRLARAA